MQCLVHRKVIPRHFCQDSICFYIVGERETRKKCDTMQGPNFRSRDAKVWSYSNVLTTIPQHLHAFLSSHWNNGSSRNDRYIIVIKKMKFTHKKTQAVCFKVFCFISTVILWLNKTEFSKHPMPDASRQLHLAFVPVTFCTQKYLHVSVHVNDVVDYGRRYFCPYFI